MKKIIFLVCASLFLSGSLEAGMLTGRIIREDGTALNNSKIIMQGIEVATNQFGGYEVNIPDGEQELTVVLDGKNFTTASIRIYSPQTKQNWRLNSAKKRLDKIP